MFKDVIEPHWKTTYTVVQNVVYKEWFIVFRNFYSRGTQTIRIFNIAWIKNHGFSLQISTVQNYKYMEMLIFCVEWSVICKCNCIICPVGCIYVHRATTLFALLKWPTYLIKVYWSDITIMTVKGFLLFIGGLMRYE